MSTRLRAEFFFDDEAKNWHYRVPALNINGGGPPIREEAERQCMNAIAFRPGRRSQRVRPQHAGHRP